MEDSLKRHLLEYYMWTLTVKHYKELTSILYMTHDKVLVCEHAYEIKVSVCVVWLNLRKKITSFSNPTY